MNAQAPIGAALLPFLFLATLFFFAPFSANADDLQVTWEESFSARVPEGWEVDDKEFRSATNTYAVAMRSPEGAKVVITFIEGSRIEEGLSANTLERLMGSYIESFFQTQSRVVRSRKPWSCGLDIPKEVPLFGLAMELGPEEGEANERAYLCAARSPDATQMIVVTGWWPITEDERMTVLPELIRVMSHSGFVLSN